MTSGAAPVTTGSADAVGAFVARWRASAAAERANDQLFVSELCNVLGVPRPEPFAGTATTSCSPPLRRPGMAAHPIQRLRTSTRSR